MELSLESVKLRVFSNHFFTWDHRRLLSPAPLHLPSLGKPAVSVLSALLNKTLFFFYHVKTNILITLLNASILDSKWNNCRRPGTVRELSLRGYLLCPLQRFSRSSAGSNRHRLLLSKLH